MGAVFDQISPQRFLLDAYFQSFLDSYSAFTRDEVPDVQLQDVVACFLPVSYQSNSIFQISLVRSLYVWGDEDILGIPERRQFVAAMMCSLVFSGGPVNFCLLYPVKNFRNCFDMTCCGKVGSTMRICVADSCYVALRVHHVSLFISHCQGKYLTGG